MIPDQFLSEFDQISAWIEVPNYAVAICRLAKLPAEANGCCPEWCEMWARCSRWLGKEDDAICMEWAANRLRAKEQLQ